ncbi:RNA polymerase sigma factor [Chitinibacteraceae bacterium HSL-7]
MPQSLSTFLASVEQRAYRHAWLALRERDAALDAVQEAMMRLSERYGERDPAEWPLLFQRILQNAIRDSWRRQRVRNWWQSLWGEDEDPDAFVASSEPGPLQQLEQEQQRARIEAALTQLPVRQRQAFLLRYWEGFDQRETAAIMGVSEGSVKTHASRATAALRVLLGDLAGENDEE